MPTDPKPPTPTGVTDEIIQEEIQAHWSARLMKPVRWLYEWVLHWAETRYAGTALAVVAFSEAVWFPIPVDPLLIALCMGKPRRSFWYAVSCTFWSTFGAMLAMFVGTWIGEERVLAAMQYVHLRDEAKQALDLFAAYGFWAVAIAALSPIPYKVFAWIAGFAGVHWLTFLAATVVFRKFRYMLIGGLIYAYGVRAKRFIDRYFNLMCTLIMILLVLIVVGAKYQNEIMGYLKHLLGN